MLSTVSRALRLLLSKIQWLVWKRPRPKVIIRRLGKKKSSKDRCKWDATTQRSSSFRLRKLNLSNPQKPIRVATFNVAMFHLAPAIPSSDDGPTKLGFEEEMLEERLKADLSYHHPKSILKQSSPAKSPSSKLKVSINLPENEISLANMGGGGKKFLSIVEEEREGSSRIIASRNYRSSVVMRSPVSLPASYGYMTKPHSGEDRLMSGRRSVLEVMREVGADVWALQDVRADEEMEMRPLSDLAAALGMKYVFAESWAPEYGNAILSKWPIRRWKVQKVADDQDHRNVLKATIEVPWAGEVDVYCTQLDHLNENWRMKQINAIMQSNDSPHVLAGGLNALDGSDYSSERWMDIVRYYEDIGKPTPRTKVMEFMKGKGYKDAKENAGECEPVVIIAKGQNVQGTCKYGTRVDYVLASPDSAFEFVPGSYSVISSKGTSDHHIVKVDLTKTGQSYKRNETGRVQRKKPKQRIVKITEPWCSGGIWKLDP
ncbi:unnamed protein product [Linum tenue]|uniref:Endonuclease/exonuclease/phosphatase domain-containing protein n=1 Tax=Linum tenue TaxID=586396 RepID=A0AAV0P7C6_9ROSI|nr:unnamed protein product [Linum tenue]